MSNHHLYMQGLDRAKVYCQVETEPLLIKERLKKIFPESYTESLSKHTTSYEINKKNINKIKIEEKEYKQRPIIRIDFSYPRYFSKHNIFPLEEEYKKIEVEENLVEIINQIIDEKIDRTSLFYDYFEFTLQEEVEDFYKFHNIISLLYRGLTRNYEDLTKVQYYNFSENENKFYTTGFTFQPLQGWKINLYSKSHENNKKVEVPKLKDIFLRMEHKLTKSTIKNILKTNSVEVITLMEIKSKIKNSISKQLLEAIRLELEFSQKMLKINFKDFTCNGLYSLVRDNLEWIFDEKLLDDIITNFSDRSYSRVKFYRKRIREILINSQEGTSPKRDYFKNIERLEFFITHFILVDIKIKCNTKKHLTFFLPKKRTDKTSHF